MKPRQALPYVAALLLLAWILGTLARDSTGTTGILSNSYWLIYIVYLIPIISLVAMVVMIIFLVVNWKLLSDALGFGIAARRRTTRKRSSTTRMIVVMSFWFLAAGVLFWRCGGIFCSSTNNSTQWLPTEIAKVVNPEEGLKLPEVLAGFTAPFYGIADIMGSPVFSWAFIGLLIISSIIILRSVKVSMDETRAGRFLPQRVLDEGRMAVQDALEILEIQEEMDPRTRIMECYQRMIRAAAGLGANVTVDLTARELESGIRRTFQLKGSGIQELTRLFEEARYSLHPITETDSDHAHRCLLEIGEELKATMTVDN